MRHVDRIKLLLKTEDSALIKLQLTADSDKESSQMEPAQTVEHTNGLRTMDQNVDQTLAHRGKLSSLMAPAKNVQLLPDLKTMQPIALLMFAMVQEAGLTERMELAVN